MRLVSSKSNNPLGKKINDYDDFNWKTYSSNLKENPIFDDSEEIEILTLEEDKEAKEKLTAVLSADERKLKTTTGFTKKVVFAVVLFSALIAVGYATFAQALAFNGKYAASNGVWDIGFISMNEKSKKGSASEIAKPSFTKHEATFHVSLVEPGDEITYRLTIKNNGNLNAKVDSITLVPENTSDDVILYYVEGLSIGDELGAGKSVDVEVTAKYSTLHGSKLSTKTMQVVINYKQK